MLYASRNDALGFARRTKKNLDYLEQSRQNGADVHEVTQIVSSMLGLVIIPWERQLVAKLPEKSLGDLYTDGWPSWNLLLGSTDTLHELVRHLRNACAHGRVSFSSDSLSPAEVVITVEDARPHKPIDWRASIRADQLRQFCLRFIELIEDLIG